jgi:flagellar hook-basal body complex protein FliE
MISRIPDVLVEQVTPVNPLQSAGEVGQADSAFSDLLRNAIERVEASSADATGAADKFLSGDAADIHSAALATQRAALQFEYVLQLRNKIVQAYQEVMRMQL